MKKLSKVLSSVALATVMSVASYAADFHFGLDVGALANVGSSYSSQDADVKDFCKNNKNECKYDPESQRSSVAPYATIQLGADIEADSNLNITPYVDFALANEFGGKLTTTLMFGAGVTATIKNDDSLSYIAGLELHRAAFGVADTETCEEDEEGELHCAKDDAITYSGLGETLSGGIVINQKFTVKALFMHNGYTISDDKFVGGLPKEVSTNAVGVSVGLDF